MGKIISKNPRSILSKEKIYSYDDGRLIEIYFVYRIVKDEKGRTWKIPLSKEDYSDCNVQTSFVFGNGIRSLRKAKMIYLLESI